jgi:hypothetical protein
MTKLYAMFLIALFAGLALAAPPQADAPSAAGAAHPEECLMMKQAPDRPGPGLEGRGPWRSCPQGRGAWNCPRTFGPSGYFLPRFRVCCVLTVLAAVLLVNLLLTILVIKDMSARGRMNGLWVPLLLIAGIPVTALYALFRIGDNLKGLEEKRV